VEKPEPEQGSAYASYEAVIGAREWRHSFSSVQVVKIMEHNGESRWTIVRFSLPYYLLCKAPGETYLSLKSRKTRIIEHNDSSWFEDIYTVLLQPDSLQLGLEGSITRIITAARISPRFVSNTLKPPMITACLTPPMVTAWLTDDAECLDHFTITARLEERNPLPDIDLSAVQWVSISICSAVVTVERMQQLLTLPIPVDRWSAKLLRRERIESTVFYDFEVRTPLEFFRFSVY
jgi:hypothetical protein